MKFRRRRKVTLQSVEPWGMVKEGNKRDPVRKIREQSVHWEGGEVVI